MKRPSRFRGSIFAPSSSKANPSIQPASCVVHGSLDAFRDHPVPGAPGVEHERAVLGGEARDRVRADHAARQPVPDLTSSKCGEMPTRLDSSQSRRTLSIASSSSRVQRRIGRSWLAKKPRFSASFAR